MASDFWIVLQWWGSLFLVGAVAWPLARRLFAGWWDGGYLFSKAVGMAAVSWIVYVLGTLRVMPFLVVTVGVAMGVVFFLGTVFHRGNRGDKGNWGWKRIMVVMALEEIFFFAALLFWSFVKAHEPSIRGLEKFMDYGFMASILNSQYFPPADMWYAGSPINYYYFGHLVTAILTRLSGLDLAYTFNLMLATIFALTLTMSFSIGKQIGGGIVTAFLVTMAGNLQTIYAFTRGYSGEHVEPFWELAWPIAQLWKRLPEGIQTYWYANATRFIPYTIHEFPGYSFVVSDVHGHVLSLPFVLLTIALLINLYGQLFNKENFQSIFQISNLKFQIVFYGFIVGVLLMTNALDGPIYFALLGAVLVWKKGGTILALVAAAAGLTSLPFLVHFKSFVSGIAVNCPPAFLANTKIGPLIFEGVEKCQVSLPWMWWLLWGFFVYCGMGLIISKMKNQTEKLLLVFFLFAFALVIFPEFFYFKDIYPAHFRSNTMFKLGYQAFILFSVVAGYMVVHTRKKIFFLFLIPQLFLVSIFPIFAVHSYFGGLKNYEGLEGFGWMRREYPQDWKAIEWLNNHSQTERFAIVEADGDSYTDYARFSAFTGIPNIIGWPVHEWLWRGSYDVVVARLEDVQQVYESEDVELTRTILIQYGVRYVIVGKLEREKYTRLQEWKFGELGKEVFRSGETGIYEI